MSLSRRPKSGGARNGILRFPDFPKIKIFRKMLCTLLSLSCPIMAISCSTPSSYLDIPLEPGRADASVQQTALLARAGDKRAQLRLAAMFLLGAGVPRDTEKANFLKELAEAPPKRGTWVYVPPVGKTPGRVIQVDRGD